MKICIFKIILSCFILKKSSATNVFIIDIPEKDLIDGNESEYIYYDYEQNGAPNLVKHKPLPINSIGVKRPKKKDLKQICDRFGSIYGIEAEKRKCENLMRNAQEKHRIEREKQIDNEKLRAGNHKIIKRVKNKQKRVKSKPFQDLTRDDFSLDYVDDYWRTRPEKPLCTLREIITNTCSYRKFLYSEALKETSSSSESTESNDESDKKKIKITYYNQNKNRARHDSDEDDNSKPKNRKPKRFQVVTKPKNKKHKKKKVDYQSMESRLEESNSLEDFPKKVVKKQSKKKKKVESFESESIPEQPLTEEEVKKEDSGSQETDSFELNKPKTKYKYLQGNRLINHKDLRRMRMQTFLPKRNTWKEEDIPKLGFFWFDAGPKGL